MSDKSFTFFELHFHDAFQLGPKSLKRLKEGTESPISGGESDPALDAGDADEIEEGDEDTGGSLVGKLVGLGVLVAVAYAVRKLLSDPSGLDALDDIEELDEFGGESADTDDEAIDEAVDHDADAVDIEVTSGEESDSGRNTGLLVAVAVTLLLLVAVAAKKLIGGDGEEIELPDELAQE